MLKKSNLVSFFYLSKLLPKNLSLHDEEDNLSLSLENSVIKVSKKRKLLRPSRTLDSGLMPLQLKCFY